MNLLNTVSEDDGFISDMAVILFVSDEVPL